MKQEMKVSKYYRRKFLKLLSEAVAKRKPPIKYKVFVNMIKKLSEAMTVDGMAIYKDAIECINLREYGIPVYCDSCHRYSDGSYRGEDLCSECCSTLELAYHARGLGIIESGKLSPEFKESWKLARKYQTQRAAASP